MRAGESGETYRNLNLPRAEGALTYYQDLSLFAENHISPRHSFSVRLFCLRGKQDVELLANFVLCFSRFVFIASARGTPVRRDCNSRQWKTSYLHTIHPQRMPELTMSLP